MGANRLIEWYVPSEVEVIALSDNTFYPNSTAMLLSDAFTISIQ